MHYVAAQVESSEPEECRRLTSRCLAQNSQSSTQLKSFHLDGTSDVYLNCDYL